MSFTMTGGKGTSKNKESAKFNETNTTQLSDRASGMLSGGIDSLKAKTYNPLDMSRVRDFQDPYSADVRDATMAQLSYDRDEARNGRKADFAKAGAFGDDRRGIYEAELDGQFDRTAASTLAGLNSAGYAQALDAASQENAGRNEYDLGVQDLIARLMSMYGNETTDNRSGTSSGRSSGRTTNVGFSFTPYGK